MGYSYGSLGDYLIELGDACINSTMKILNFRGSTTSGWDGYDAGLNAIHISPLGGSYVGSVFVGGGQVTDAVTGDPTLYFIPEGGWPFEDVPSMVDYYQTTINDLFSDWWQIPFPQGYAAPLNSGREASAAIALLPVGGRANVGQGPEGQWSVEGFGADRNMGRIDWISDKISKFDGDAIDAFNRNYVSQLPLLATGQQYMTKVLWATAGGQKEMWLRAQQVVADTAGKGVAAAKAATGGDGAGLDVLVKVVGAALSLATVVVTEGAAAPIIAGGATITGVVSSFLPEGAEDKTLPLGSTTPVGVLSNMAKALEELKSQIRDEEHGQVKALTNAKSFVEDHLGSFDFKAPGIITETDPDRVREAYEIGLNTDKLREIAHHYLPDVAQQFRVSAAALDDDGGSGPWSRPGSLGVGATGPWPQWQALAARMSGILDNTYDELHRACEKLEVVAADFDKTDAQIHADLEKKNHELDQVR
jgi:hypothetical protein